LEFLEKVPTELQVLTQQPLWLAAVVLAGLLGVVVALVVPMAEVVPLAIQPRLVVQILLVTTVLTALFASSGALAELSHQQTRVTFDD
jgi:hypothetical protein